MKAQTIITVILVTILLFNSCGKDDSFSDETYYNSSTIYSTDNSSDFRELVCIINLVKENGADDLYMVTPTIHEIVFTVNGKEWGVYNTLEIDTTQVNYIQDNDLFFSTYPLNHSLIAPYIPSSDTLTMAGEYADLLLDINVIEPGSYLCRFESLKYTDANNDTITIYPQLVAPFVVEENAISTYLGTFDIYIEN